MIGIPSHLIANSAICIYMIAHTYIWLHNIQNLVTTAFVKYNDTKFKWSILTYPHNFRVLLFQYSLNSRFSICNSGQTSTRRLFREKNLGESFCWFINKVATGFNLLPSSWQMEQNSWPITLRCKPKLLLSLTPLICRLLFISRRNKFILLSFADSMFFYSFFTYWR